MRKQVERLKTLSNLRQRERNERACEQLEDDLVASGHFTESDRKAFGLMSLEGLKRLKAASMASASKPLASKPLPPASKRKKGMRVHIQEIG